MQDMSGNLLKPHLNPSLKTRMKRASKPRPRPRLHFQPRLHLQPGRERLQSGLEFLLPVCERFLRAHAEHLQHVFFLVRQAKHLH